MLSPAKRLREQIAAKETVIGVMASDHIWPLLVELCQRSGLDYLVVDREHGPHSDEAVAHLCQVARLADFPILMRTVSCELSEVRRAMDLGPSGLILPCVETVDQLDDVQSAVYMPPRGTRRPGAMGNYWMKDIHYANWRDDFENHFVVVPQIESLKGVESAAALAEHPLTTALGLGPYDLSADMGCCWDPEDAEHQAALVRIREAAEAAGKTVWMGADAVRHRREGYHFLWIGSVSGVLQNGLASAATQVRSTSI